ncbi:MAG TPA: hypothetical protein VH254_06620 [Candidatus Udaeobacter sp.]|nr:hypothetical protein [Candidatus Udaeobacter sp.]
MHPETLEDVLGKIDVRDADWRLGNYQILEEIGRGGMASFIAPPTVLAADASKAVREPRHLRPSPL